MDKNIPRPVITSARENLRLVSRNRSIRCRDRAVVSRHRVRYDPLADSQARRGCTKGEIEKLEQYREQRAQSRLQAIQRVTSRSVDTASLLAHRSVKQRRRAPRNEKCSGAERSIRIEQSSSNKDANARQGSSAISAEEKRQLARDSR